MDSGNSGSMQSSSGGDEEFDSRAESISAFLGNNNNSPLNHTAGSMSNPPPQQPPPTDHHYYHHHPSLSSSMFDPLSNYFDPLSRSPAPPLTNPNSLLNLDAVWPKNLRSDPSCTDLGGFMSTSSPTQQLFTNQTQSRTSFSSSQVLPGIESTNPRVSSSNEQTNNNNTTRNPKKRSRASRRAPTTFLTTDTNNFRAMVQEFTGIPAPPFTSSPFPRTRLDLFGSASALRSAASHLDPSPTPPPPPPYLLRPFAQKLQPPPPPASSQLTPSFLSSSSSASIINATASTTTSNINKTGTSSNTVSATTNSCSSSVNYQLPSDLGLFKQQSQNNLFNINMQNPILNFHPLLQSPPPKYPPILGTTKPQQQGPSLDLQSSVSHLKMGGLEDFGLSRGHLNTNLTALQNMVTPSSDTPTLRRSDNNSQNWEDGVGSNEGEHQALFRSINANSYNNSQRITNGKAHYSVPSSDFHGDKASENVGTRSEGMVESWICSSD